MPASCPTPARRLRALASSRTRLVRRAVAVSSSRSAVSSAMWHPRSIAAFVQAVAGNGTPSRRLAVAAASLPAQPSHRVRPFAARSGSIAPVQEWQRPAALFACQVLDMASAWHGGLTAVYHIRANFGDPRANYRA
jgi:hypothetical protein